MSTQKYNIRIPNNVSVIYHKKKKTLVLKGPLKQKSLKLELKVFIDETRKIMNVSPVSFSKISNREKKRVKALRNTTVALIKHALIETSILIFKKLKINGVGYRVSFTETLNERLLTLKLGYSHFVYFKVPNDIRANCFTKTKLSVFGNSYSEISQVSAMIRSNKLPEPYKGKGILYEDEKIDLKEGKKV